MYIIFSNLYLFITTKAVKSMYCTRDIYCIHWPTQAFSQQSYYFSFIVAAFLWNGNLFVFHFHGEESITVSAWELGGYYRGFR